MDDYITISAKTLDEAITEALLALQTTSEHLYYEVVQKETSGVFGLFGGKPCIIRAKVMTEDEEQTAKAVAAEKERMAREKEAKEAAASEENKAEAPAAKEAAPAKKETEKETDKEKITAGTEKEAGAPVEEKSKAAGQGVKTERAEKKASKPKDIREDTKKKPAEKKSAAPEKEPEPVHEDKPRQPVKCDPERVQVLARDFLTQVLGAMGMQVELETSIDLEEGDLCVNMNGQDMGILIGKRGQTLDSLQYLTSLVVNKETEGYLRVKLDTENYRERRKETLETLARNIAYKVKRTKHPVSLEPMNPYERRVIHSALQGDKYVVTRSEGEDPYRHVVISLKNEHYSSSRNSHYSSSKKGRSYEKRRENPSQESED